MDLHDALSQISEIRHHMAKTELFRGYRAATTAFSGLLALAAGLLQPLLVPDPAHNPLPFVLLWTAAAALCLAAVGIEMTLRTARSGSPLQRQLTLLAIEQFTPAVVAGAILTYVFCDFLPDQSFLLPGLWMILFSLGVFSSARLLPRPVFAVGGFYLVAGVATLILSARGLAFSPWPMSITFALGQSAIAAILYTRLERTHA